MHPGPHPRPSPRPPVSPWLVFAIALSVYVATAGGSLTSTDAVVTYNLTASLVERGSIALEDGEAGNRKGADGRMYSWFGVGQSIYNIPFYVAGRTIEQAVGPRFGRPGTIAKAAVGMGTTVPAAGCAAVLFLFAWRLTRALRPSLVAAFALAFGTILWPYAKFGFNMPLAAFLIVAGTYLTWRGVRDDSLVRLAAAGALLGCAFLTRHELPFMILPLFVWVLAESWPRPARVARNLAAMSATFAVAAIAWLAYNHARFGHPLDTGQLIDGQSSIAMLRSPLSLFGRSMTESLGGLLFAPSTSLFLYSPIVVIAVLSFAWMARRDRSTALLLAAQVLCYLLFLASAGNWWAGRSYGSRYLVPAIPLLSVPLAYWFRDAGRGARVLGAAVLSVSVLVQLPGVLVDYSKVEQAYAMEHPRQPVPQRLWSWTAADLVLNTRAAARQVPDNLRYLAGIETPPPVNQPAGGEPQGFGQQLAFSLDFWWLYLFYLGALPAPLALCGFLVPLAVAIACARSLHTLVRRAEGPGLTHAIESRRT